MSNIELVFLGSGFLVFCALAQIGYVVLRSYNKTHVVMELFKQGIASLIAAIKRVIYT